MIRLLRRSFEFALFLTSKVYDSQGTLHRASASRPERVFELVCQLKFPGLVLTLAFPRSVLALPPASLKIPGNSSRAHLELALTATRQAQQHCTEQEQ
jgi:hypothetical protein